MLQQAIDAIRAEKFAQARDILKKLLYTDQQNPDYWVWMSAAMETQKERLYCLQSAYKLDPTNAAARRGLTLMGALPAGDVLQPFPMNHPRAWEAKLKLAEAKARPKLTSTPAFRLAAMIGIFSLLLIGTAIGVGAINARPRATQDALGTSRPTVTPYATNSNAAVAAVNTTRPLSYLLSTPYTPTPIYAATPHGEAAGDSYKGAMRAYRNSQWELMGMMMAQVATAQPGSADALYFIGESNRLSGKYPEAIDYYKAAIAVNSNFAPSYLGRALANMKVKSPRNVLEDLNKAIALDPNYAEAYLDRGLYYQSKQNLKAAQADLQQAKTLNDSPLVELNLARILLAQQDNASALEAAKLANQMDVTMLDSYLVLGMAYRANGEIDQAVEVLETYLTWQPDNAEAFAILGAAYYNRGDYARAQENLEKSLNLDRYNADGYFWLGQTYLELKDTDKALVNYQKARDLNPSSFDVSEGLAKAYMARAEYNNSYIVINKIEKAAEKPVQRARFLYIRAISLEQLNQPAAALRDWTEIVSLPVDATTDEMRQMAQQRIIALQPTVTPTVTPRTTPAAALPTAAALTGTLPAGTTLPSATLPAGASPTQTLQPTKTIQPTDTRMPTSTPKGLPPVLATPTP
jgi:tetratricopeptide (TPR) repeat protein